MLLFFRRLNSYFWNKTVDIHLLHWMLLVIHQLAMRLQLTHKHVRFVVSLLRVPLQHLWLRPLDLLLPDTIQVPVYLFPQNSNCLPDSLKSIYRMLSKGVSNPLYYHSFTSWSDWPAVWVLQPSLYRQQNSALIKISWRWMPHIKTTSFRVPHDSAELHGMSLCWFSSNSLLLLINSICHIKISPSTSEFAYQCPNPFHRHCHSSHAMHVCLVDYVFLSCGV